VEHNKLQELVKKMDDDELDDLLNTAQREYKARLDHLLAEAQDRAEANDFLHLTLLREVPHRID
jgi:hypothetical protein